MQQRQCDSTSQLITQKIKVMYIQILIFNEINNLYYFTKSIFYVEILGIFYNLITFLLFLFFKLHCVWVCKELNDHEYSMMPMNGSISAETPTVLPTTIFRPTVQCQYNIRGKLHPSIVMKII